MLFALGSLACRFNVQKPYTIMRVATTLVILGLSAQALFGAVAAKAWLGWALVLATTADVVQLESVDRYVYRATKKTVSGHSLKHVAAGGALALFTVFYLKQFSVQAE